MQDSNIIALFLQRSERAIGELERKYGAACSRTANNILGNRQDAEECVNDSYLAVWNTVPPQQPDPLIAYVLRIVRNISLKRVQHNAAAKRAGAMKDEFISVEHLFLGVLDAAEGGAKQLLGSFGVSWQGRERRIVALPDALAFDDIARQGLPHFGGAVTYHLEVEIPEAGELFVRTPHYRAAVLTLALDSMKATVEAIKAAGLDCKVIIGGAPVSAEACRNIGADEWAHSPKKTVDTCKSWAE